MKNHFCGIYVPFFGWYFRYTLLTCGRCWCCCGRRCQSQGKKRWLDYGGIYAGNDQKTNNWCGGTWLNHVILFQILFRILVPVIIFIFFTLIFFFIQFYINLGRNTHNAITRLLALQLPWRTDMYCHSTIQTSESYMSCSCSWWRKLRTIRLD